MTLVHRYLGQFTIRLAPDPEAQSLTGDEQTIVPKPLSLEERAVRNGLSLEGNGELT